jgi:hypothetical protein
MYSCMLCIMCCFIYATAGCMYFSNVLLKRDETGEKRGSSFASNVLCILRQHSYTLPVLCHTAVATQQLSIGQRDVNVFYSDPSLR